VAQAVDERARHGLRFGAGAFEGPFDSRLQRSTGDAFAV